MSSIDLRKFLKAHKSGWLALTPDNKKKVASGKTLREVLAKAKTKGIDKPSIFKVPDLTTYYIG